MFGTQIIVSHWISGILGFCFRNGWQTKHLSSRFSFPSPPEETAASYGSTKREPGHRGICCHPGGPSLFLFSQIHEEIEKVWEKKFSFPTLVFFSRNIKNIHECSAYVFWTIQHFSQVILYYPKLGRCNETVNEHLRFPFHFGLCKFGDQNKTKQNKNRLECAATRVSRIYLQLLEFSVLRYHSLMPHFWFAG